MVNLNTTGHERERRRDEQREGADTHTRAISQLPYGGGKGGMPLNIEYGAPCSRRWDCASA